MNGRIKVLLDILDKKGSVMYPEVVRRTKRQIEAIPKIFSKPNQKHMINFMENGFSRGLSPQRLLFFIERLKVVNEIKPKDFSKYDREDVKQVMLKVNTKGYAPRTVRDTQDALIVFMCWLHKREPREKLPDNVRWLRSETIPNKLKAEDLITPQELQKMIEYSSSLMTKAILTLLYSSGLRPGELRSIQFGKFSENGNTLKFYVSGKMYKKKGEESVYVVNKTAVDLFKSWVNVHPTKRGYVFQNRDGKPLSHSHLNIMIKRAAKGAGINRMVNCYLFRHSYGTRVYSKYPDVVARKIMRHSQHSKMPWVYTHLSETDVLEALQGKKQPELENQEVDLVAKKTGEEEEFIKFMGWLSQNIDLKAKFREWETQNAD